MVKYKLNGKDMLGEFGFTVSASKGLLDMPKFKDYKKLNFGDMHGEPLGQVKSYLRQREITLEGFISTENDADMLGKTSAFTSLLAEEGLKLLTVSLEGADRELVYLVYNVDGIAFDKRWQNRATASKCSLKLIEPEPVKKALKFTAASSDTKISIVTDGYLSIYLDGELKEEILETAEFSLNTSAGESYYIILSGELDKLESLFIDDILQYL